jgi:hypothetical protein
VASGSISREWGLATSRRLAGSGPAAGSGYHVPFQGGGRYRPGVRGLRDRVAHLLDTVSGPTA